MSEKWPLPTAQDIARFMSFVDMLPSGCWFWTGARSRGKKGKKAQKAQKWYGSFSYQGLTVRAHAFSQRFLGKDCRPLPPGHDRDHICVFSMCVCPDHIEVVPKEENQRRRIERRRKLKNPEEK